MVHTVFSKAAGQSYFGHSGKKYNKGYTKALTPTITGIN